MAMSRLDLHESLKSFIRSINVYYEPPEGYKMKYPCIVYKRSGVNLLRADDSIHRFLNHYTITYITSDVDEGEEWRPSAMEGGLIQNFLKTFPYSSFDRQFKSDNMLHVVFSLYY